MRVEHRRVMLDVVARDEQTTATATLAEGERTRHGTGDARRKRTDFDVPQIGDELAVGRALVDLGVRLIEDAAHDIGSIEGHEINAGELR